MRDGDNICKKARADKVSTRQKDTNIVQMDGSVYVLLCARAVKHYDCDFGLCMNCHENMIGSTTTKRKSRRNRTIDCANNKCNHNDGNNFVQFFDREYFTRSWKKKIEEDPKCSFPFECNKCQKRFVG